MCDPADMTSHAGALRSVNFVVVQPFRVVAGIDSQMSDDRGLRSSDAPRDQQLSVHADMQTGQGCLLFPSFVRCNNAVARSAAEICGSSQCHELYGRVPFPLV
jgi:hypothetical protein